MNLIYRSDSKKNSGIIPINIEVKRVMPKVITETVVTKADTDGKHSFLFWLVVPIIITWLAIGYILGIVKDRPKWLNANAYDTLTKDTNIKPVSIAYPAIKFDGSKPYVTFWFDDAWLSQYMVAYPILKENGFVGTIAVPTDAVETPTYANWAQLRVLQENGWEITNHSKSHNCKMQNLKPNEIDQELEISKLTLWKNGLSSDIFVSPCGVDSENLRTEVRKDFIGFRTVDPGYNTAGKVNFYNFKVKNIDQNTNTSDIRSWIDYAQQHNSWLILVFHKVGESEGPQADDLFNTNKDEFRDVVSYIKSKNIDSIVPSQIITQGNI